MGLVIVVLRAPFGGFDALADPVGWGLVVAGLLPLAGLHLRLPQRRHGAGLRRGRRRGVGPALAAGGRRAAGPERAVGGQPAAGAVLPGAVRVAGRGGHRAAAAVVRGAALALRRRRGRPGAWCTAARWTRSRHRSRCSRWSPTSRWSTSSSRSAGDPSWADPPADPTGGPARKRPEPPPVGPAGALAMSAVVDLRSGGDDVEVDRRVDLVVHLHGHLVRAQGLDRVADDDLALVDRGARVGDRTGDVADGDGAEQTAALARADRAR